MFRYNTSKKTDNTPRGRRRKNRRRPLFIFLQAKKTAPFTKKTTPNQTQEETGPAQHTSTLEQIQEHPRRNSVGDPSSHIREESAQQKPLFRNQFYINPAPRVTQTDSTGRPAPFLVSRISARAVTARYLNRFPVVYTLYMNGRHIISVTVREKRIYIYTLFDVLRKNLVIIVRNNSQSISFKINR